MQRDMIGLVALDCVLRLFRARMVHVAFAGHILPMHPHDASADATSLGIPAHVIADLESLGHGDADSASLAFKPPDAAPM